MISMSNGLADCFFERYTIHHMSKSNAIDHKAIAELIAAMSSLEGRSAFHNFLYDIATPQEISVFSQRFQIAKLLWTTSLPYVEIAKKTGASTTTVTRVARFLNQEPFGGYREVLQSQYQKTSKRAK